MTTPPIPPTALAALALLLALTGTARGQEAPAEAVPWYTVEVVIFERLSDAGLYEEVWPADPGLPDMADALSLGDPQAGAAFQPLAAGQLRLGGITAALRRSGGYRPLLHQAWRQPGAGAARARAVYLADDSVSPSVEGILRLRRGRFLHLEADLLHRRAAPPGAEATTATAFRMQQSRRMRSEELHYLDHPLFGLIVEVTPWERPAPEAPASPAADDALLLDAPSPSTSR